MANNKLIENDEIKNLDINKIINISKTAKSNNYKDLSNIPEKFNPSYHTHNNANNNANGFMNKEDYTFLKKDIKTTFGKIEIQNQIYDLKDNLLNISTDNSININCKDKIMNIGSKSINYSDLNISKGEEGDIGDAGENGYWYKPIIEDNILTWEKITDDSTPENFSFNIKGKKGSNGLNGLNGLSVRFNDIERNPYTNKYINTEIVIKSWTGLSEDNTKEFIKEYLLRDLIIEIEPDYSMNIYHGDYTDTSGYRISLKITNSSGDVFDSENSEKIDDNIYVLKCNNDSAINIKSSGTHEIYSGFLSVLTKGGDWSITFGINLNIEKSNLIASFNNYNTSDDIIFKELIKDCRNFNIKINFLENVTEETILSKTYTDLNNLDYLQNIYLKNTDSFYKLNYNNDSNNYSYTKLNDKKLSEYKLDNDNIIIDNQNIIELNHNIFYLFSENNKNYLLYFDNEINKLQKIL